MSPAPELRTAPIGFKGVLPGVFKASTVVYDSLRDFLQRNDHFYDGYVYGQSGTPTHYELAIRLAEAEGGGKTILTPSGMAAIGLVNSALLQAGDHVLLPSGMYGLARQSLERFFSKWGVQHSYYSVRRTSDVRLEFRQNTKLVWLESPTSLVYEVEDISSVVRMAHECGVLAAMDNSWATPEGLKPLEFGVDFSVQSLTKYVSGHSDLLMGCVTVRDELLYRLLKDTSEDLGYSTSSEDCYQVMRGLASLRIRLAAHYQSATALATCLQKSSQVREVFYPPLSHHPTHDLWRAQYSSGNGLLSIVLRDASFPAVDAFFRELRMFKIGSGWGGTTSIVAAYPGHGVHGFTGMSPSEYLIRLSVGLEDVDLLAADLHAGLRAVENR